MKRQRVKKRGTRRKKGKLERAHDFMYGSFLQGLLHLKDLRNIFLISLLLFLLIGVLGFMFPLFFEEQILEFIRQIIEQTRGLGPLDLSVFIIFNNLQSSFFAIILGIFLGIPSLIILIMNGYVLGFVASKTVAIEGPIILWRLLPHGIFEIPAVILSIALGLKLGGFIFKAKEKGRTLLFLLTTFLMFLIVSSILLMIISASALVFTGGSLKDMQDNPLLPSIMDHPLTVMGLVIVFFISLFIGLLILRKSDKEEFLDLLKKSLITFLFIVIPLLVIAGVIEGILIWAIA
jgi:stage II sporulation protein M